MGILERVHRIVRSNVNQLLDRAEDPHKSLLLHIEEMRQGVQDARSELVRLGATEKLARRQQLQCEDEGRRWEQRAVEALRAGDEQLARRALEYKHEIDLRCADYQRQAQLSGEYVSQLQGQVEMLEQKVALAHRRSQELAAQRARSEFGGVSAQRQLERQAALAQPMPDPLNDPGSAFSQYDRVDERISHLDAEMEAMNELNAGLFDPQRADVERQFRQLEQGRGIDGELDDLKRRIDGR